LQEEITTATHFNRIRYWHSQRLLPFACACTVRTLWYSTIFS